MENMRIQHNMSTHNKLSKGTNFHAPLLPIVTGVERNACMKFHKGYHMQAT